MMYSSLIILSLKPVVLSSMISKTLGPLPNIQLFPHDQKAINKMIRFKRDAPFNHQLPGASCTDAEIPKSFRILYESVIVGRGIEDFRRASNLMFSFQMINRMPWANVVLSTDTKEESIAVGTVLCTLIKCYKLVWTLNPVRICNLTRTSEKETSMRNSLMNAEDGVRLVNQVAYSTIDGHLISGEERFRVSLMTNNDVVFDIYSFTKGSGLIGAVIMPFIRSIQHAFFHDAAISMKKLMNAEKS